MARSRPWIPHRTTGLVIGWGLLIVALFVLYDVYDRRGFRAPFPLSAILPW